jgi:hypothetical protein
MSFETAGGGSTSEQSFGHSRMKRVNGASWNRHRKIRESDLEASFFAALLCP